MFALELSLVPLSLSLRKSRAAYGFTGSKNKINHLLFMNNLKLYFCNEKGLDLLDQTLRVLVKI